MSKKNKKENTLYEMMEPLVKEILEPRLTPEQITYYAEAIYKNLCDGGKGCTEIDCCYSVQRFPQCTEIDCDRYVSLPLTGEGVIMLHHRFNDTREWIDTSNYINIYASDAYATIGKTGKSNPLSITRGIWTFNLIETGSSQQNELESLYAALIANDTYGDENSPHKPGKDYEATKDYALVTWFIRETIRADGGLFHLKLTESSDVAAVKTFIAEMTGIMSDKSISARDSDNKKAVPNEEVFKSLISKLTEEKKAAPRPPRNKPDRRKLLQQIIGTSDDKASADNTTDEPTSSPAILI